MTEDEKQKLIIDVQGLRQDLQEVLLAIKGNDRLGVAGVLQHMKKMDHRLDALETDVRILKDKGTSIKGWIAGVSAAGGLGGILGSMFG